MTPSQPGFVGAAPLKWSPSSTVTRNSVFALVMPSLASRWKNAAKAALYSLSWLDVPSLTRTESVAAVLVVVVVVYV